MSKYDENWDTGCQMKSKQFLNGFDLNFNLTFFLLYINANVRFTETYSI